MSLTAVIWLGTFAILSAKTLKRASWGIPLYLSTFYAQPGSWWWGRGVLTSSGIRWNLMAALILALGVFLHGKRFSGLNASRYQRVLWLLTLFAINATVVHFLFADNVERSGEGLTLLWKQLGLLILMCAALQDEADLKVLLYSIIIGSAFIGYEVVVNDRGYFRHSRLEGIVIAGAVDSNHLAGLLALSLPLAGCLVLAGSRTERVLALLALPLIIDVILRCNSRGAFLALLAGAAWLVARSQGRIRRYALAGVALGLVSTIFLLGNQNITERFYSTFASAEQRDSSAQSRIGFWQRAMEMIGDYPLGLGAEAAFKSDLGLSYVRDLGKSKFIAVHNGYLDIAVGWGIQGFLLYASAIIIAWRGLRFGISTHRHDGNDRQAFLGACIEAALIVQLMAAFFISSFDGEWFLWWVAIALAYQRLSVITRQNVAVDSTGLERHADLSVRQPVSPQLVTS